PHRAFDETRAAKGDLQFDLWGIEPTLKDEWEALKKEIAEFGLRNSLTVAIAPTATIATIAGCYECIEPQVSNLFKRETLSGDFVQVNNYLVDDLKQRGLWNEVMRSRIKQAEGSISEIDELPEELRTLYRTAWELPQKSLIDLAAARGPYIDQSQSLNLFMASPTIGKLSSMYAYAWRTGLKTTYYLRSRPATRIRQTTVAVSPEAEANDSDAVTCSLENPESCEACQ
ncbi:MAG: ribonucleoside-diphosphate reductase subunit alpha, partial [bacterium]